MVVEMAFTHGKNIMQRRQGFYYSEQGSSYMRSPNNPSGPVYPRERPIHWGIYEILSSAIFITLSLMFVAAIAALVLHIIGFDSLTQLYGFDQVIEHIEITSAPSIR